MDARATAMAVCGGGDSCWYFCIGTAPNCFYLFLLPNPLCEFTNVYGLHSESAMELQGHNRRHSCAPFREFNAFAWCSPTENTSLRLLSVRIKANNHQCNKNTFGIEIKTKMANQVICLIKLNCSNEIHRENNRGLSGIGLK